MAVATVEGESVFYLEFGDPAQPPLILLHGLYGDSALMAPLAERFADDFHVIAPDALGHGRSGRPADFTLVDQGRMVNGLVAGVVGVGAAVMGISMGSYLAAQAAILEPARTTRLVLVVPKAHGTTSSTAAYAKRIGFDLAQATPEEAFAALAGALWSPDTPQSRRDEVLAVPTTAIVLTPQEMAAVERSLAGFDLRPTLPSITAPTLVISGRFDGLNSPEVGREVAERIPGARFEVYEHSGHMLGDEETDRLVADVTAFALAPGLRSA